MISVIGTKHHLPRSGFLEDQSGYAALIGPFATCWAVVAAQQVVGFDSVTRRSTRLDDGIPRRTSRRRLMHPQRFIDPEPLAQASAGTFTLSVRRGQSYGGFASLSRIY